MSVFKDALPIVKEQEINFAIDSIYHGKWEAFLARSGVRDLHESACFVVLWSCLACGALLLGNTGEAGLYAMKAVLTNSMYDLADLPQQSVLSSTLCRAEMLLALLNRFSGNQEKAMYHFSAAEKLSVAANDGSMQGPLKALTSFGVISSQKLLESLGSLFFSEEDLDDFSFEAKIYYKWRTPLFYHIAFAMEDWVKKYDCYKELLLAEKYLLDKWNRSPFNWLQVQVLLMVLEAGHLQMFQNAAQRAREFASKMFERVQKGSLTLFNVSSDGHDDIMLALDLMAFIFYLIKDLEYFEIMRTIWNSLPRIRTEKPLPELSEMEWDGFTGNVLRNILRTHVASMFFKQNQEEEAVVIDSRVGSFSVDECVGEGCKQCFQHCALEIDDDFFEGILNIEQVNDCEMEC